jgi:GT2 family glycosyltransferase/predicted Zn-dependent protease
MACRYLFGPVSAHLADENLHTERQASHCLAFDAAGTTDLAIRPSDRWEHIVQRFPADWQPDFVVLSLGQGHIPPCLWSAPIPLVGLADNWDLNWHYFRRRLRQCELVLTNPRGVEVLAREGIGHAQAANLQGLGRNRLESPELVKVRDIDILAIGELHPALERELLPCLGRVARLAGRWRVVFHPANRGDIPQDLLARARIAFHRSRRGECGRLALEAAAAGALLLLEADNAEVPEYLRDRQECILYSAENLEELLEYYLETEPERQQITAAARERARQLRFDILWEGSLELIERELPAMRARVRERPTLDPAQELLARTWQALAHAEPDALLAHDLAAALVNQPRSAAWQNALGLVATLEAQQGGPTTATLAHKAAGYFQRAFTRDPSNLLAGLNWVEALAGSSQTQPAIETARRLLVQLDRTNDLNPETVESGHFPPAFDTFRVEWERAAWAHAGQPDREIQAKRALLRWRLHTLLADLTGLLGHRFEAVLARPDLPGARSALGCALVRAKHPAEALSHLARAVADNPFDLEAARALFQALGETGDGVGQCRLADDRRLLARAAPQAVPQESWMVKVPPVGDERASIILLCCNELAYTKTCSESILRHTRPPYELILVDNGSQDDTPAYLEEVSRQQGPARVKILRNATNVGFAAGCNQALAWARGRHIVFLNNDTVVTGGWLENLIAWSLQDWPQVGLVGPVSNYAPPPQHVVGDYKDLDGLDAFGRWRQHQFARKALRVDRLTGFCLLVRREVLERVGGFDEGYGLGFFEDDDLCVRAREAGFQLRVALNVYIHHFGSRTFHGLGIDCGQQLRHNLEQFKAKWGPERTAGYQLPSPPATPEDLSRAALTEDRRISLPPAPAENPAAGRLPNGRLRVSLCMIVKNEEANLPACLESVADLVDEIIVVDTGSTDRTKEVASRFGARVFDFPWVDSFAAARNESLRHATGDWILWLDADDRFDEANRQKLRALLTSLQDDNAGYVIKCLCLPDHARGTATVVDHLRLFRNHPAIRWEYRIHEQILAAVRRQGGQIRWTDVTVQHSGYQDGRLRARKLERDLRLLQLENAERPDDPFNLFNLGSVYNELDRPAEALPLLQRSLELSQPGDSIVRKLYALIVQCQRQLGQPDEAFATCQAGRRYYPDDVELLFVEGVMRRERKDLEGAEACFLQLLETPPGTYFASVDAGLHGYKARHNLAGIYQEQGRLPEAEAQWQSAVTERPDFLPGWLGLGTLHLAAGRWEAVEAIAQRLDQESSWATEAVLLRARVCLARKEFAVARQMLEEAISQAPQSPGLHTLLSYVLLQEGNDPDAAERTLRILLELEPTNTEARHNLAVLLRERAVITGPPTTEFATLPGAGSEVAQAP